MAAGGFGAAVRQTWPYALVSGGVALAAFLLLPAQSLPDKYLQGDSGLVIPYALVALSAASLGVFITLRTWGARDGRGQPKQHLAVPPVLVVLILTVLISCGGERSRWGTGLLCAAVAVIVHLSLGLRWRLIRVAVWVLVAAGSVLITIHSQTRWRADDFRATGQPFVVADIPGYRLKGTYADVGAIILEYRGVSGQTMPLSATITRSDSADYRPGARCFELAGGHHLCVEPSTDRSPLPAGITVRPVSAMDLAAYPVSGTSLPD